MMRDNSGSGKAKNNNRDPTLKEHEAEGGHKPVRQPSGEEASIGGNVRRRGTDPSLDTGNATKRQRAITKMPLPMGAGSLSVTSVPVVDFGCKRQAKALERTQT